MDSGFVDLDILLARVKQPSSKVYFLEAVKAYRAGAMRAALASAWVAVVYDLIAKYRELTAMGDAAAASYVKTWDNATSSGDTKKLLELEARIVKDATENTQLLNPIAGRHLQRLREDRHLCAHPAFSTEAELFVPSPELVRLHLVNAIEFVLAVEPLQGRAIIDQFSLDVQSAGFPTTEEKLLDYVEQRYLNRVRSQNVKNFGMVLTKSLLKGVPEEWEAHRRKIVASLIAVRDRSQGMWPEISGAIARLIDAQDPDDRPRSIAFIAAFPEFWPSLDATTQTALKGTVENLDVDDLEEFSIFAGAALPQFRDDILALIDDLDDEQLEAAIAFEPFDDLWPKAVQVYKDSVSFRGSEANFRKLIAPFAGHLVSERYDELLDAIVSNGQNWSASDTPKLLLDFLKNVEPEEMPSFEARNRLSEVLPNITSSDRFAELSAILKADGWTPPPSEDEEGE